MVSWELCKVSGHRGVLLLRGELQAVVEESPPPDIGKTSPDTGEDPFNWFFLPGNE